MAVTNKQRESLVGDTDADGDLDLADYAVLQRCIDSASPSCSELFDLDESGGVDLSDFAAFAASFTGPW